MNHGDPHHRISHPTKRLRELVAADHEFCPGMAWPLPNLHHADACRSPWNACRAFGSLVRSTSQAGPVRKRILVVDDDLHSREGLRDTLLSEGYRVESSADSWQAIRKIKECPFDIAIIDLDLPDVHGVAVTAWDLARIFRVYNPAISLIVVGAEEGKAVRAQVEQLKVSEFLVKPISPTQLKGIVRTLEPACEECPGSGRSRR